MIVILGVGELDIIADYLTKFEEKLNKIKPGISKFSKQLSPFDYGTKSFEVMLFTDAYLNNAKSTGAYVNWFKERYKDATIIHVTNRNLINAGIKGDKWVFGVPKKAPITKKPIVFTPMGEDLEVVRNEDYLDDYEPDEEDEHDDNN